MKEAERLLLYNMGNHVYYLSEVRGSTNHEVIYGGSGKCGW